MRLTGTMRIELTDVNTGEVTAVTEENMVTDAVNHILGLNPMGVFYEIGESIDRVKWQEALLPVCPNMIGGILLFSKVLEERVDNIYSLSDDLPVVYVEDNPELGGYQVMELCDDGYSGTNMERPGMEKLLDMAKKGLAGCIIVKDFSRFGRDYLTVSDYVDQIFPFMGIRFISINDNYDSAKCNGATSGVEIAFRNVIYGYYSQDLSVKVRSGKRTKAQSGKFMSPFAPIGYQKSPGNRNRLVVEPEGAAIVRRIFQMAGEGMSVMQILRALNRERIPTPSQLKNKHGEFYKWWVGVGDNKVWDGSTVVNILRDERYLGKNVYGKYYRPVVGNYRTKRNSREEWVIVEDCHEAILSREEFTAAQKIFREQEGQNCGSRITYLFSGKIRCANCRYALHRMKSPAPRYYLYHQTNTKKRDEFNRMIEECKAGNIDMIITKSISRFARNTIDCLKYIRQLKALNISVFFEKEYIQSRLYLAQPLNIVCFILITHHILLFCSIINQDLVLLVACLSLKSIK